MNKMSLTFLLVGANAVMLNLDERPDRDLWEDYDLSEGKGWYTWHQIMYDIDRWAEKAVSDVLNTFEDIGDDIADFWEPIGDDIADFWEEVGYDIKEYWEEGDGRGFATWLRQAGFDLADASHETMEWFVDLFYDQYRQKKWLKQAGYDIAEFWDQAVEDRDAWLEQAGYDIADAMEDVGGWFDQVGYDIADGVEDASAWLEQAGYDIQESMDETADWWEQAGEDLKDVGEDLFYFFVADPLHNNLGVQLGV